MRIQHIARPLFALVFVMTTGARTAEACKPAKGFEPPPEGPVSRGEAIAGLATVGAVTTAASLAVAARLDNTDRFPVWWTALASAPGIAASSFALAPSKFGPGCAEETYEYVDVAARAWVPFGLGVAPTLLAWWISGSSTKPPVTVSAYVDNDAQGLSLSGRW